MIGRLMLLSVFVAFILLAIVFDWFGMRDWIAQSLSITEQAVESLSDKGDVIKEFIDTQKK
jgi:hypothetical protein